MKKIFSISLLAILGMASCTKKQFQDSYPDPSKLSATTVDRQFAGMLSSILIIPCITIGIILLCIKTQ